jgi:hypothetical protein
MSAEIRLMSSICYLGDQHPPHLLNTVHFFSRRKEAIMEFREAVCVAERNLTEGASLEELKELVRDLRALSRNSILADLIEIKIMRLERRWDRV